MGYIQKNMDRVEDLNSQINTENLKQKRDLVDTRQMLIERVEECKYEFGKRVTDMNNRITTNGEKLAGQDKVISGNGLNIASIKE